MGQYLYRSYRPTPDFIRSQCNCTFLLLLATSTFLHELTMKQLLPIILLTVSCNSMAEWIEYSSMPNGDVYLYDNSRVQKNGSQISIWTRIRYKTSVMAASSYQSFLKVDCSENSETVLQSTFYTDRDWNTPAMATNTSVKPKRTITENSSTGQLVKILCKDSQG